MANTVRFSENLQELEALEYRKTFPNLYHFYVDDVENKMRKFSALL